MPYDNTNKGVLFKNDKQGNENWPDYKGSINIDGTDHWLSAWIKKSKEGKSFMSLSIGDPKEAPKAKRSAAPKDGGMDIDNDLPFLFNISTVCDTMGLSKSQMRIKHGPKALSILCANQTEC